MKIRLVLFILSFWLASFLPMDAQDRFSDCTGAIILCEKKDLVINKLEGKGKDKAEIGSTSCSRRLEESHSVWIKWQVAKPGKIGFTLSPLVETDDIDFVLYQLDGDIKGCSRRTEIRCMASGKIIGAPEEEYFPCTGKVGLSDLVNDMQEGEGCSDQQDNFLATVEAQEGENYILYINNYSSSEGVKVEWTGDSVTFRTPLEIEKLPVDPSLPSKAIYFKRSDEAPSLIEQDWSSQVIDKAFAGKITGSRAPNTFVGCYAFQNESEYEDKDFKIETGAIFPNPANTQFNLQVRSNQYAVARMTIFGLLGSMEYTREIILDTGEQIISTPLDQFPSGIYFVHLRSRSQQLIKKLIVAKQ